MPTSSGRQLSNCIQSGAYSLNRDREEHYGPDGPPMMNQFMRSRTYGPPPRPRQGRGRGRASIRQQPYRNAPPSKAKRVQPKIPKYVYLLQNDTQTAPRGSSKASLYRNGQVKTALKIDPNFTCEEFAKLIDTEFADILDNRKPEPRQVSFIFVISDH